MAAARVARMLPPDPSVLHPVAGQPRVVLLRPLIHSELVEVGEFTYYDDPDHAEEFQERNVLYHYGPEKLIIGRFCSLATGVRFLMNGANHRMNGPSTFPFPIMGGAWGEHFDLLTDLPEAGDTVVGNDVWLGRDVLIMPGTIIGDGCIVASGSVVSGSVPPYTIVGGNPAQPIRRRFDDRQIEVLLRVKWWDWPLERITRHIRLLMDGNVDALADLGA